MTTTSVAAPTRAVRRSEPEWVVVVVVVVALAAGWLLKSIVEGQTVTFSSPELTLRYPAAWLKEETPDQETIFNASDIRSGSLYHSQVAVHITQALPTLPVENVDVEKMSPAITAWAFQRGQQLKGFRTLDTAPAELSGRKGVMMHYVFVSDPISSPYREALPVVVEAMDYLFPAGDKTIILTVAADGMHFEAENSRWFQPILQSVTFTGK
jgi:hypothetical protein